MNFNQKELNIAGRWHSRSKMPERYGRAVCDTELLLRNKIAKKFVSGCGIAPSFHLPLAFPDGLRGGRNPGETTPPAAPGDTLTLPPLRTKERRRMIRRCAHPLSPLGVADREVLRKLSGGSFNLPKNLNSP